MPPDCPLQYRGGGYKTHRENGSGYVDGRPQLHRRHREMEPVKTLMRERRRRSHGDRPRETVRTSAILFDQRLHPDA